MRKQKITTAFSTASTYHTQAKVQLQVANNLARHLHNLDLPPRPYILELGCGSGFLSVHLHKHWPDSRILLTDIAHPMLLRCRNTLQIPSNQAHFATMDGEYPAVNAGWDLITSSMTVQWFDNLPTALHRLAALLNPGGWLMFSTLGQETFQEWRHLCDQSAMTCGTPHYPSSDQLQAMWPTTGQGQVTEERITQQHPNPWAFLQELKALGAHQAAHNHQPATAGQMRRLLCHGNPNPGFSITHHILYGHFRQGN
ncbi:MAG: methyltransferase domain-containing protein [Magnetococcales bacterium]|nr:methyltransferase domain-containing protein [Magnetococcales bacterium]MBF0322336.1 methyltransferase domain-containing protein [Magnetococcales bacterium]